MGMRSGLNSLFSSSKNLPVVNVSWYDAIKFCSALSKKEGLEDCYTFLPNDKIECDFTKKGYRLPTEAEWEYACRAGTKTECYSGNDLEMFEMVAWYNDNSDKKTHEVGLKESNAFSLYDMHGNVWEWCWDGYSIRYYKESPEIDPTGVNTASNRVLRGGSWYSNVAYCRSAFRVYVVPDLKSDDRGFRIVRTQ
jgi:formylglycine-generating enzyme required for sulfatase activity